MSAWVCSHNHIAAIVEAGIRSNTIQRADADAVGQDLLDTNVASVNYRYNDTDTPAKYTHRVRAVSFVQLAKAVHCYAYQSCEHDGWETSQAKGMSEAILHRASQQLPGYDAAEWGIE